MKSDDQRSLFSGNMFSEIEIAQQRIYDPIGHRKKKSGQIAK
jgi:hypothetical protein